MGILVEILHFIVAKLFTNIGLSFLTISYFSFFSQEVEISLMTASSATV
jgi:hypothetical protein